MRKTILIVIVLVVIAGSLWRIARHVHPPKQTLSSAPVFDTMSDVLAAQVVAAAPQGGDIVIWLYDGADKSNPVLNLVLQNLQTALPESANLRVAAIERIPVTGPDMNVTADQIVALIQKHATASVIVSFIGAPHLTASDIQTLGDHHPWFIVVDAVDSIDPTGPYDPRLVKAAIVARIGSPPTGAAPPKTPQEMFDRSYQVVNPK